MNPPKNFGFDSWGLKYDEGTGESTRHYAKLKNFEGKTKKKMLEIELFYESMLPIGEGILLANSLDKILKDKKIL